MSRDEMEGLSVDLVAEIMSHRLGYEVTAREVEEIREDIENEKAIPTIDEHDLAEIITKVESIKEIKYFDDDFRALIDVVLNSLATLAQKVNPCPYTHSHTRKWCGHPLCRKS